MNLYGSKQNHARFIKRAAFKSLLLFSMVSTGCKPKFPTESETRHVLGDTVQKRDMALMSCKEQEEAAKNPKTAQAKKYLEKVLDTLITENNLSTAVFTGYLARKNLCIAVVYDNNSSNAQADPLTGLITFYSGIFREMDSDAQVAGVLAHELAHVTLNHSTREHTFKGLSTQEHQFLQSSQNQLNDLGEQLSFLTEKMSSIYQITEHAPPNVPENAAKSEMFEIFLKNSITQGRCKERCAEYRQVGEDLLRTIRTAENILNQQKQMLLRYYTAEVIANKAEADADEVGLEFLVRADIDPSKTQEWWRLNARDNPSKQPCSRNAARGTASHPSACWRSLNINSELTEHFKSFAPFLKRKRTNFISGPKLSEVKAELQR